MIVVHKNLPQLLLALRPHDKAVPSLEGRLHKGGNIHRLYGLAGGNTILSIYDPEPSILDVVLGGWPFFFMYRSTKPK